MTSHLNSHRTTDIKPEMLSGVQTGNGTPHDKYDIHGIAHEHTNRKDDIFMQRELVQNFTFILVVFFPCMLPSPLCGIFLFSLIKKNDNFTSLTYVCITSSLNTIKGLNPVH